MPTSLCPTNDGLGAACQQAYALQMRKEGKEFVILGEEMGGGERGEEWRGGEGRK